MKSKLIFLAALNLMATQAFAEAFDVTTVIEADGHALKTFRGQTLLGRPFEFQEQYVVGGQEAITKGTKIVVVPVTSGSGTVKYRFNFEQVTRVPLGESKPDGSRGNPVGATVRTMNEMIEAKKGEATRIPLYGGESLMVTVTSRQ